MVVDERCLLHDPRSEIWIGVATPAAETAGRLTAIREALNGARFVDAAEHPDDAIHAVHEPALVEYLRTAWDEWHAAGLPVDPGQPRVVPYVFAHSSLTSRPFSVADLNDQPGSAPTGLTTYRPAGSWYVRN